MSSVRRALSTVAAASVIASGLVVTAAPAAAAPAAAQPAAPPEPGQRADAGSAAAAARSLGRKVEVTDATTETRRRWANPDGTMTDEVYAAPVRTRKDGEWVLIDTSLRVDGDTVRTGATVGDVRFSAGGDRRLATVSEDGVEVSLTWPKPLPAPAIDGNVARYADVLPGIDLELKAGVAGYEQSFILKRPSAAAAVLRVPIATRGVRAVAKDGATVFVDSDGTERAWIGAARMWDAAGHEAPVGVSLVKTATGRALEMTPDAKLMARPDLAYPVTVDPPVTIRRWVDTYADSGNPTTNYGSSGYLKIGKRTSTYRSFIAFDVNEFANKHITDVYMYLGNWDSVACTAKTTSVYQVTTPWTSTNVTWNNQPTPDLTSTGLLATATSAAGGPTGSTCDAVNWMTFHDSRLTTLFNEWANYAASNYGMTIRTSETDTQAAKDFLSGEATSWTPRAAVTYNTHPNTVAGRAVAPSVIDAGDNVTRHTNSTTPTLLGGACDAEGTPLRVDSELWSSTNTSTGTLIASSPSTASTVASCARKEWTVPTTLADGTTYYWRSRAYDGTDYSKSWSSWVPITVDTSAPNMPTLSFSSYPENTWSTGGVTQTGTVGTNGSTDVVGYYYGLDEPEPTTYGSAADVTLTSPSAGPHTFYLRSVDRAGNKSPTRAYSFSVGEAGITSPAEGARTEKTLTLAAATKSGWEKLTWKWRRGTGAWTDLTGLKDTNGNPVSNGLTVTSGVVPTVTWDAEAAVVTDGPLEIAATVESPSVTPTPPTPVTVQRTVTLDRTDFGSVTATASAGPGSVNLITGNLALSATDVSVDAPGGDLTVSRSFNSLAPQADQNGPFGPGWVSSVPVSAASSDYTGLSASGSLVTVTMADGDTIGFTGTYQSGPYTPEYGAEDLTLSYVAASGSDPARYELKDLDGNATGFTKPGTSTAWLPTKVTPVGGGETKFDYETVTVNGLPVTRVTGIMAAQPAGVTTACSFTSPSATVGCRVVKMTYAASTTTPPSSGTVGDYPHRLEKVTLYAYNPDKSPTPGMDSVDLAEYAYDSTGRLAQVWDPRLSSLKSTYTYNADGQVATLTPPAEEAWTFAYAPLSTEAAGTGRLKSVSRPTLLSSPATATTTFVYRVAVTGTGAPYDLSATELARSGQTDLPVTATAVFPATTAATFGSGSLPVPSSWDRATVHYLNADGREVNTADPNGGISTTEYDGRGNAVRTLTAGNRARALAQGTTSAEEADVAERLSSVTVYSADGLEVKETFGPEHDVRLTTSGDPVRAREHVTNTYDEGMTGGPYHLLTTSVTSARVAGETSDRSSESRTTKTGYGSTTASWTLGLPMTQISDAGTGGLSITTRTTYTADGRVLTQTLPAGGTATNTAATRVTRYYSAGVDSTDAACGLKPEWVDLVCSVSPGGQPTGTALPTTYTTYDMFGRPRVVTEKSGLTTLRTTTMEYDSAGRPWKSSVSSSTGTTLPTQQTVYDANGRATETWSSNGSGGYTARVVRTYNSLGQLTGYTDADGTSSTTTYDVLGRPLVTDDGKGTQTRTYDGGSERRGLVTSLVDSQAGTWTATYDVDGTATIDWPNGLRETQAVDEAGAEKAVTYAATTGCTGADCVMFYEQVEASVHGQWIERESSLSEQAYAYDGSGRLTRADDTVGGECTVRKYTFDAGAAGNGNRTKLETFAPASDDSCQTTTAATTVTSAYDAADRITTSGTVYDALGRTTTVPDADALDSGNLTIGYYVNDFVRSVGIAGGTTKTYTVDVDRQRVRSWTDGTTTRTHHYGSDSDSPSWTAEGGTAWTRNIGGISGDLAAVYDSTTSAATLQLTNLHGDVVATASTTSTALASTRESTEYGTPRGTTGTRYAWLGGKQRAADTAGGVSIMGVRVYNPATGRFLQVDPVYGGNSNAYVYPHDPLTMYDLDGRVAISDSDSNLELRKARVCRGKRDPMACAEKFDGVKPGTYKPRRRRNKVGPTVVFFGNWLRRLRKMSKGGGGGGPMIPPIPRRVLCVAVPQLCERPGQNMA